MSSYRFPEAVISLCIAIIHQQLEAMSSSTDQPLRLFNIRCIKLIQLASLHVLKHDAVALKLQFAWILNVQYTRITQTHAESFIGHKQ